MTEIPLEVRHGNGDMNTFSWTSNFWMTNWVANQAYNRYDLMIDDIKKVQNGLESCFQNSRKEAEKELINLLMTNHTAFISAINAHGAEVANKATTAYKQLGEFLLVRIMDGNMKKIDENGNFIYSEYGMPIYPEFPGYNEEYFINIVRSTGDHFLNKGNDIAPLKK